MSHAFNAHPRYRPPAVLSGALVAFALVVWLSTGIAQANYACGVTTKPCEVQIDNAGNIWIDSAEKLTENAVGDPRPGYGTFYIYERTDGKTILVSTMPDGSPIPAENRSRVSAYLTAVSPDGQRIYLSTDTSLVSQDTDGGHELNSRDYYEIHNGHYTLLSTGPLDGQGSSPTSGFGQLGRSVASDNGQYFYWVTAQALVPEDTDEAMDVYQRHDGQVRLVSVGPTESPLHQEVPWIRLNAELLGISPDGSTAYFWTEDRLTPDDTTEKGNDLYSWRDGVIRRVTRNGFPPFYGLGWIAPQADGSLYFISSIPQTSGDTDENSNLYRANLDGTIERLTSWTGRPGGIFNLEAASRGGSRFLLATTWRVLPSDTDSQEDLYMWSADGFRRISPDGPKDSRDDQLEACAMSADGRRVYFDTAERLSPLDTDSKSDVYEWSEGSVRLVTPPSDGTPTDTDCLGISPNGRYVAFSTNEQLNQFDYDAKADIYEIDMEGPGSGRVVGATLRPASHNPRVSARHRVWLVTAESIAPRMAIARRGVLASGLASVRLTCPRKERSGPCHGRVRLLGSKNHRLLAAGVFRIPVGDSKAVQLRGTSPLRRAGKVLVRVTGADRLGNRKTVSRQVVLSRFQPR